MKKNLLIISCLAIAARTQADFVFNVASLNLNAFDSAYTGVQTGRPSGTVKQQWVDTASTFFLDKETFSIICFQEWPNKTIESSQAKKFKETIEKNYTLSTSINSYGDKLKLRLAIAYDKDKFTQISKEKYFDFATITKNAAPYPNGFFPIILKINNSSNYIGIISTHFKASSFDPDTNQTLITQRRTAMAQAITDFTTNKPGDFDMNEEVDWSSIHWIVCGDFNTEPTSLTDIQNDSGFSTAKWAIVLPATKTFFSDFPDKIVDYIFSKYKEKPFSSTKSSVIPDASWSLPSGTSWFSDHALIWALFTIPISTTPPASHVAPRAHPQPPPQPVPGAIPMLPVSKEKPTVFTLDATGINMPYKNKTGEEKITSFSDLARESFNKTNTYKPVTVYVNKLGGGDRFAIKIEWDTDDNTGSIEVGNGRFFYNVSFKPSLQELHIESNETKVTLTNNSSINNSDIKYFPTKIGAAIIYEMIKDFERRHPHPAPQASHVPEPQALPSVTQKLTTDLTAFAESLHELHTVLSLQPSKGGAASEPLSHYKEDPLYEKSLHSSSYPGITVKLQIMNIVDSDANAIVNAANELCIGGGGIDGAITTESEGNRTSREGQKVATARRNLPGAPKRCPIGEARITISGLLKQKCGIKYIIHATAPDCRELTDSEAQKKEFNNVYKNIFETADHVNQAYNSSPTAPQLQLTKHATYSVPNEGKITSITVPMMGVGIYACDINMGSNAAVNQVTNFLNTHKNTALKEIRFVFWQPGTAKDNQGWVNCMGYAKLYESKLNAKGFN